MRKRNPILHFEVQQITAIIFAVFGVIAILINVVSTHQSNDIKIFNIISILVIGVFLSPTYFCNHKYVRAFQVFALLLLGVFTIFVEYESQMVSDYFLVAGILLFYTYEFLSHFKIRHTVIIFSVVFGLRVFAGYLKPEDLPMANILTNTAVSVALITFVQLAIQAKINHYLKVSLLNDALFRLSLNMRATLDELNLKMATDHMHRILREKGKYTLDELFKEFKKVYGFVSNIDDTARQYRMAILMNQIDIVMLIDLKDFLGAIIAVDKVTLNNPDSVEIIPPGNTEDEVVIKCVPYEMYTILQNLITYFVELIDKNKTTNNRLSIFCVKREKKAIVTIFSPNISLPYTPTEKELLIMPQVSWKRTIDERRLISLYEHLTYYNGVISFHNFECGGAEVAITLPLYDPKADGEPECLKKVMSQGLI